MKRQLLVVMLLSSFLMLGACGNNAQATSDGGEGVETQETKEVSKEEKKEEKKNAKKEVNTEFASLEEILEAVETEMDSTINTANEKYSTLKTDIGTYKQYKANPSKVDDFFKDITIAGDELFEKYDSFYESYFKMALAQTEDNDELDRIFDDFYDTVYEDAFDDYYDEIYDRLFDDFYDDIYDDMFDDAYDEVPHQEYSDEHSTLYQKYSDAHSEIYKKYSHAKSKAYVIYSNMRSNALFGDERDYDAIMAKVEIELEERAAEEKRVSELVEVDVNYEIRDGKAYVTGLAGEGNEITINSEYNDCDVVGIDASAFEGTKIQTIVCWADIETIGDKAFKNCDELVDFSIPSSVTVIGNSAFENCVGIKDLLIWGEPDIGERAFAGCTAITQFSAGSDTKKICDNAFDGCSELEQVYIWGSDTEIGKDAFANCPKLERKPEESGYSVKLDNAVNVKDGSEETSSTEDTKSVGSSSGIRPEFQTAMDEYKKFFKEYCDFLKKYVESDDAVSMLSEYSDYMTQYVETMEAFDKVSDEEMSKEEEKLYLDTTNEINKMLIDAM